MYDILEPLKIMGGEGGTRTKGRKKATVSSQFKVKHLCLPLFLNFLARDDSHLAVSSFTGEFFLLTTQSVEGTLIRMESHMNHVEYSSGLTWPV